ncbi:MAG: OmpA family protein [Verrucomicrobiota bacterium]
MKTLLSLSAIVCLLQMPALAQTTVTIVKSPTQVLTREQVSQRLSIAPRVVVLPTPSASTVIEAPAPVVAVPVPTTSTVKTTTTVVEGGRPRRVYNAERNVVVVEEANQTYEMPYVTLPVLFVKETAELLDSESRAALDQIAAVIQEISKNEPATRFDIEGHTSVEGTDEFNMGLSAARAQRVFDELTQRYGIPASVLSAHGHGENYPQYPNGDEGQLQMDRRVLVVRVK